MALQSHFFFLWVLSRACFCQTKSECWQGGFTEEICCNKAYPAGNPDCWDGNFYTYDICCPPAGMAVNSSRLNDLSCWTGGYTQETCCDHAVSPRGNPACWLGEYTYERCCSLSSEKHELLHEIRGESEACWNGNHDLEKICCNPFHTTELQRQLSSCWSAGYNYNDCCKRDSTLVASLVALRRESESALELLPAAKDQELDLPFQPTSCQNNGGLVDRQVCGYLQQAEDMLRHPADLGCWSEEFPRESCCSPEHLHGNPTCWDLEHTFERCCLGVSPLIASLQEFYRCEHCISMFQQPRFTCEEIDSCQRRYGGTLVAMSKGSSSLFRNPHIEVLCLPRVGTAIGSSTATAAFVLQWVRAHHGQQTRVDLLHGSMDTTLLEVAAMFALLLAFRLSRFAQAICRRSQPVLDMEQLQSRRNTAIDGARLIGTAAVLVGHLNILEPNVWWHLSVRFTDIFGVLSVLVMPSHSEGLLRSADALWRKLGRQLPLSFMVVRLATWTAGLCPHFDGSCEGLKKSRWSGLVEFLTFSWTWYFLLDMKVWLFLRILHWFNQRFPPGLVLALAALICLRVSVAYQKSFREIYYEFWPYRLPMSLLVYAFLLQRTRRKRWALQHPFLWCSIAALLCSLGFVNCIPESSLAQPFEGLSQIRCAVSGWEFFWGGVFFHLGVAMICIQPCVSMPRALNWMVCRLSPLASGFLGVHLPFFGLRERCERMVLPWFYLKTPPQTHIFYNIGDELPRWIGLASSACCVVVSVLATQLVLWIVQQPWEGCWFHCPKPLSRVLVVAYILLFLWITSQIEGDA